MRIIFGKNNNINLFIVSFSVILRNRSGTPTAFKMEFFVTIVNDYLDFKCWYFTLKISKNLASERRLNLKNHFVPKIWPIKEWTKYFQAIYWTAWWSQKKIKLQNLSELQLCNFILELQNLSIVGFHLSVT